MGHGGESSASTSGFLAGLAQGDRDSVGRLFREHAGFMLDYLKKTKRQHGLAETEWIDAVQDAFVKLVRQPPAPDQARDIGPLLLTMAMSAARDRARMARRQTRRGATLASELRHAVGAEVLGSETGAANKEYVEVKLAALTPDDRQAIAAYMKDGPERHVASLANQASIKTGAAQMRFVRAKEKESDG